MLMAAEFCLNCFEKWGQSEISGNMGTIWLPCCQVLMQACAFIFRMLTDFGVLPLCTSGSDLLLGCVCR